jgi:REP element-mobilizing transposase RayT
MVMRRTVHGVHLCWGTYGFWLPNDPRGSGSREVWADHLKPFGEATFVEDRTRSRARQGHDRSLRRAAKRELLRPAVLFNGTQARCAAVAFGKLLGELDISVWACTVLPDHVHLVVGPSAIHGDILSQRLKGRATVALVAAGLHPFQNDKRADGQVPKCWQEKQWPVFKYDPRSVRQAIRYVEDNPLKEGKKRQTWPFVIPYTGDQR